MYSFCALASSCQYILLLCIMHLYLSGLHPEANIGGLGYPPKHCSKSTSEIGKFLPSVDADKTRTTQEIGFGDQ